MQANSTSYFNRQELERISNAVKQAESNTSGEIVPVLASSSDDYDRACFLSAILFSLLFTIVFSSIWILFPTMFDGLTIAATLTFLGLQLIGLLVGFYVATSMDGIRKAFIPHQVMTRSVFRAAHEAFLQFQVSHTENATGILIYVSLFERTVVVLADRSINRKHDQKTWDEVRDLLVDGLKSDDGANGFISAISRCGEILSTDFPIAADDKNELSNELRLV